MNKKKISFSVVTTCRNEIKSLPRWKQNILDQTRPPNEIVIVDAFSNDGTLEYLQDWANVDSRLKLFQEKGNAAKGRNTAIDNTTNEHILSTDMGVRLNNIWCEELMIPFEKDDTIEVVAGNTCIDIETIKSRAARAEYILESGGYARLTEGHVPGNRSIAYKKKVWLKVGKLPEDLTFYADDSVFGRQMVQANFKFAYATKAMTYWARPNSIKAFFKEQLVYGRGDGEAFIKTPRAFKLYQKGILNNNLVPVVQGLNSLSKKQLRKAMFRALKKKDIVTMLLLPRFVYGRTFSHAKGYLEGYVKGVENCKDCRNRLKRDKDGYSLI